MPRIVVNGAVDARPGDLQIRINERPATFLLSAAPVSTEIIYRMTPRTFDLLLIAESVFTADSLISRGGPTRPDLGTDWSRDFRIAAPVSDVAFWNSVRDDLIETLSFLTDDRFAFDFVERPLKLPKQKSLGLEHGAQADQVALLSGGLDSLTGSLDALTASTDARLLLVTHCSASKTMGVQKRLARTLAQLFPKRTTWAPVRGHLHGVRARETTQRSRSFLYGALGFAAASLVGLSRFSLYENGIVSFNLPISRQVIGAMATRTTHPLFLRRLEGLLSKIADRPFAVENPYAWLTKTEVVQRLHHLGGGQLIEKTTSCSSVRRRSGDKPLCGCCSQCLDRRFAVLAAGVAEQDPAERYEVDLFLGERPNAQDRTMALDWTRHACNLAAMRMLDFAATFGAALADVAAGCSERPSAQVLSEAFHMHRRHGDAVRRVTQTAIGDLAASILDRAVPPGSLLASLAVSSVQSGAETNPDRASADDQLDFDASRPVFPLRLVYDPGAGPQLTIKGLGEFSGAHLSLVGNLRSYLEEDVDAQLLPDGHRFVAPGRLGNKNAIRQHARRCRNDFARQYEVVEGARPESDILVHSNGRQGYRLDPTARFEKS